MAIYLVDLENVHSAGLMGAEKLTEKDSVYIFYTNNSNSMNFEAYNELKATAAKVIPLFVSSGNKNALDFQLASFAGYLAGTSEDREVTIVSLDTGYVFVKNFWERTMHCTNFSIKFAASIKRCLPPESIAAQNIAPQNTAVFAPSKQIKAEDVFTVEQPDKSEDNEKVSAKTKPLSPAGKNLQENKTMAGKENEPQLSAAVPVNEAEVREKLKADEAKKSEETGAATEETSNVTEAAKVIETYSETDKTDSAVASLQPAAKPTKTAEEKKKQSNKDKSKAILTAAGVDKKHEETIRRLVQKSSNKQQFYIGMTQAFGKDTGLAIYKSLRPEYVNLKKLM